MRNKFLKNKDLEIGAAGHFKPALRSCSVQFCTCVNGVADLRNWTNTKVWQVLHYISNFHKYRFSLALVATFLSLLMIWISYSSFRALNFLLRFVFFVVSIFTYGFGQIVRCGLVLNTFFPDLKKRVFWKLLDVILDEMFKEALKRITQR